MGGSVSVSSPRGAWHGTYTTQRYRFESREAAHSGRVSIARLSNKQNPIEEDIVIPLLLIVCKSRRASYRDLLGTAESIIEMDGEMHDVEAYIGEIGQRCNTRLLEKKGANLRSWTGKIEAPGTHFLRPVLSHECHAHSCHGR